MAAQEVVQVSAAPFPEGLMLNAVFFRPAGDGPFPAMVLHHGCGGMYDRRGEPSPIIRAWASHLNSIGVAALAVDSFRSRGYREMCTHAAPQPVRPGWERNWDAFAALRYLRGRADVRADRVGVMGWSHGGSTTLWASSRVSSRRRAATQPGADFRLAIAFYPGCAAPLAVAGYDIAMPLLVLIGELDDWTPAAPCLALADSLHRHGASVDLVLYPDTHHGFDAPGNVHLTRSDTATAKARGGVVTLASNPAARADALERVDRFLEERLLR